MSTIRALRIAALPVLWAVTAGLMASDWAQDPYDPQLEGSRRYGHNHEDALAEGLVLTFIELAIMIGILRPWSYERSWGRALIVSILLVPWNLLSMIGAMHQGGIRVLHWMWITALLVGVVIAFLYSAIAAYLRLTSRR